MPNPFTHHPHAVGETYGAHAQMAARFGVAMLAGGVACLVHALLPFLFQKTGSNIIRRLYAEMERRAAPGYVSPMTSRGHPWTAPKATPHAASSPSVSQPSP